MKIRLAIPDRMLTAEIVNPALETITRANVALILSGEAPLWNEALKRGIRWQPEPAGQRMEHFDLATEVMKRGWGDCDDLAPWKAASFRVTGQDPDATAVVKKVGPGRWHAITLRGDGSEARDPSKEAGMGRGGAQQGAASVNGLMSQPGTLALATVPYRGGHAARVDMPWKLTKYMLSGHGFDAQPTIAMERALRSVIHTADVSGTATVEDMSKAVALRKALQGGSARDIEWCLQQCGLDSQAGHAAVGSLWKAIKHRASAMAHPLAKVVPVKALVALANSPRHLAEMEAHMALGLVKGALHGNPKAMWAAVKKGEKELTQDPAWKLVQKGASLFPGGQEISAGMAAAAALGAGMSLKDAVLAGVRAALPPGAQAGFDVALGMAHGKSLSAAAMAAARQQIPEGARTAFDAGLAASAGLAHGRGLKGAARDAAKAALPRELHAVFDAAAAKNTGPKTLPTQLPASPMLVTA